MQTPLAELELEQLQIAGRELITQFETDFAFTEHESENAIERAEGFWPVVLRVAAVGPPGQRLGGFRGSLFEVPRQVRNFARRIGATLARPERHGRSQGQNSSSKRVALWYDCQRT
jgi:hypothetical protein